VRFGKRIEEGAMLEIIQGRVGDAASVISEAAAWLASIGRPLWDPQSMIPEKFLEHNREDEFFAGYLDGKAVAAMILKFEDLDFWPELPSGISGFIHKLCVRRAFSGKGLSGEMIERAGTECLRRGITALRLDCDSERKALRRLYESNGFSLVRTGTLKGYKTAWYLKRLA
jgi:GNAT superfamily N-acetyltransferase